MSIRMLRVGVLDPCRFQKEHHFSESNIDAIAADLREGSKAILNPIHVIPKGGGRWEIVAGHDRVEAAKRTGLVEIPVRDFGSVLLTGEQVYEHWRADNAVRKSVDKRAVVEETLLEWKGAWSDRRIAACCGCAHPLVASVRSALVQAERLEDSSRRLSSDGKPRTVRKDVPSKRGIPHPTATVPSRAAAAEPETPESSSGSTDSSSPGGVSEPGIDRAASASDPRDQTEPAPSGAERSGTSEGDNRPSMGQPEGDVAALKAGEPALVTTVPDPRDQTEPAPSSDQQVEIAAPEANPSATTPSTGASDSHRVDAARDGEPAPESSPPLSVVDGGLAEVRTVLGLSMRQLTKVELLAITDDEETRLTAIGRYCQQIVTRRRLVCEEAAKEAAKGAAA